MEGEVKLGDIAFVKAVEIGLNGGPDCGEIVGHGEAPVVGDKRIACAGW
jgi:hypothetical protein